MAAAFEVYNEIGVNFGHKGDLQWKRFILGDLHEKPVPAMPAVGRPEGRNTNQVRNTNQL